jgi:hypothetical protein
VKIFINDKGLYTNIYKILKSLRNRGVFGGNDLSETQVFHEEWEVRSIEELKLGGLYDHFRKGPH